MVVAAAVAAAVAATPNDSVEGDTITCIIYMPLTRSEQVTLLNFDFYMIFKQNINKNTSSKLGFVNSRSKTRVHVCDRDYKTQDKQGAVT